jgi:hypothetical protein
MSRALLLCVVLAGCGGPTLKLREAAATALECPQFEVSFDSYDDDEATAECRDRGVFLVRAGDRSQGFRPPTSEAGRVPPDQWIVMSSFPVTGAASTP